MADINQKEYRFMLLREIEIVCNNNAFDCPFLRSGFCDHPVAIKTIPGARVCIDPYTVKEDYLKIEMCRNKITRRLLPLNTTL